jgi:16S rRNA (guanine966-N2)-methyltransferase
MKRRKPGSAGRTAKSGTVRIGAGRWKGKALEVPSGARPTSARAREALFDILGPRVEGARVLDLHAGSGAVGLEALSRGASAAVLVDRDPSAARRNAERLGAVQSADVLGSPAAEALRRLHARGERFDVIFSDPPYGAAEDGLEVAGLLADGGLLVVQSDEGESVEPPPGLSAGRRRAYGRNVFHFFIAGEPEKAR